jgi:hypothetical protein
VRLAPWLVHLQNLNCGLLGRNPSRAASSANSVEASKKDPFKNCLLSRRAQVPQAPSRPTVALPVALLKSAIGLGDDQMRFVGIMTYAATALACTPGLAQTLPAAVSSSTYRELTCVQLVREGHAISMRGFAASGLLAGHGGSDVTETAPAVVIVWPLPSTIGDKQQSDRLALADDQMNALEQASIASQCSIRFQRPPKG